MTKDIKQIQEENRIMISELTLKENDLKLFQVYGIKGNPLRLDLSRVLLALEDVLGWGGFEFQVREGSISFFVDKEGAKSVTIVWDLEIETLEQQAPETQIAINQLLTK